MEIHYASLSDRIRSIFIDTLFIILMMFIFSSLLDSVDDAPNWLRAVMFLSIWLIYEPVCVTLGCTIGQYIMHIRVRSSRGPTRHIHIVSSYIRYIIKLSLGVDLFFNHRFL